MSFDFSKIAELSTARGKLVELKNSAGRVIWAAQGESNEPIVLEVEKITTDTYAGETTYTGEQFILLDIYPKTANSTVNVTFGGLTKTLTFSGTNAQQVYFGTFNGVADEVETPASGTLTIEGACKGFGVGVYAKSSKSSSNYCGCITAVTDWGSVGYIPTYAFRSCTGLTSVTIPSSVTSINSYAFYQCTGLTSVSILNGLKTISDYAFCRCTGLTSVTIPASVTSIGKNPWKITAVNNVISVDSGNTAYKIDGNCLIEIASNTIISGFVDSVIPTYVEAVGFGAFYQCTGLTSVTIPASVTSIGAEAFYECTGLTSVTIPSSVTIIGNHVFYLTSGTGRTVTMLSTTPATLGGAYVFDSVGKNNIIVPVGSGDTYKAAEYWSEYADYIVEAS